jgi:hypothetical protein
MRAVCGYGILVYLVIMVCNNLLAYSIVLSINAVFYRYSILSTCWHAN